METTIMGYIGISRVILGLYWPMPGPQSGPQPGLQELRVAARLAKSGEHGDGTPAA